MGSKKAELLSTETYVHSFRISKNTQIGELKEAAIQFFLSK